MHETADLPPLRVIADVLPADAATRESWRMKFRVLLDTIERVVPEGGDWCTVQKAHTLACLIIGLRPTTVVEIGVWMGGSLIPMALAVQELDAGGRVIAIDPWSSIASVIGQHGENAAWWSKVDHEDAYQRLCARIAKHELESVVTVHRMPSDNAAVPDSIDLLHIDGNHAEQAIRDVARFAPAVRGGGICVLDDVGWEGEHVARAADDLVGLGFRELYPLDTGKVFQRVI